MYLAMCFRFWGQSLGRTWARVVGMLFARLFTLDHFLNGELGFSQLMYNLLVTSQATNAQSAVMPRLISVLVVSDS